MALGRYSRRLAIDPNLLALWGTVSLLLPDSGASHFPVNSDDLSDRPALSALAGSESAAAGAEGLLGLASGARYFGDAGLCDQNFGNLLSESRAYLDGISSFFPGGITVASLLGFALA